MKSLTRDFQVFSKDDWILYFLDKNTELLHRDIIDQCRKLKNKASNQNKIQVYSSPNSFYKAYKNLEAKGYITLVKIRNHPKSEKFSRVYNGYAVTNKGRDYIARKQNTSKLEKIATLNNLARENFQEISGQLNDFLEQFEFENIKFDVIYDKMLLLLAQTDYEKYLKLILEAIPERSVRIKNLLAVISYFVTHAAENISFFAMLIFNPETSHNWGNLEKFASLCGVSYPCCLMIREKLLVDIDGIIMKVEKTFDNIPHKVETEFIFTTLTPELNFIHTLVENTILSCFVKNALQEEIISMKIIIEKLNTSIIYSEVLNTFHTGAIIRAKGKEEFKSLMHSFRFPSINLAFSQFNKDMPSYSEIHYISLKQNQYFKQFLLEICRQQLIKLVDQEGNGLLEIPAILIKELEKYSTEEIRRYFKDNNYNDQYSQAMRAKERKNYQKAIQIFKDLLSKDVKGDAYSQIYQSLIMCYAIQGEHIKILLEFEKFWKNESPEMSDFILYCKILIVNKDYSKAVKKIEEWLEDWFGDDLWTKLINKAKECKDLSFQDYIFSPSIIEFIEINVIEEEILTKHEFEEILNLFRVIKKYIK